MKKMNHQFYLAIGILLMAILVINERSSESAPANNPLYEFEAQYGVDVVAANPGYFSLETGPNVIDSIVNFPRHLWNMIFNPSESQMRFFLRDGFAFGSGSQTVSEEGVEEAQRIGRRRDDSDEIYMLTWQPAEGFVRRSKLIHDQEGDAIPNATYINSDEPLVYIFNSHPHELIASTFADLRVGEMDVIELSHEMALIFEEYGIPSLVEDRDVRDLLRANGWGFNDSYRGSRIFVEERIHQYPTLQFFFDLHRDGVARDIASANIDGVPYARILFVVGAENPAGYEENYRIARQLHNMLEEKRPGISRGVMISGGPGRNGVYNQDIASTLQLIEIGTVETTVEEAMNTMEVLADVLAAYILTYVEVN